MKKKTILLTGASRGIGAQLVERLAHLGYDLVLVARNEEALSKRAESIKTKYPQVQITILACDLSQRTSLDQLLVRLDTLEIDIVIHNAGVDAFQTFESSDLGDLERNLYLNLTAPILITKKLISKWLIKNEGLVISMSSLAGLFPTPFGSHYSASKSGLWAFTQALGIEYAHTNLKFVSIHPGFVNGDGMHEAHKKIAGSAPIFLGGTTTQDVIKTIEKALTSKNPDALYVANRFSIKPLLMITHLLPNFGRWLGSKLMKNYLSKIAHHSEDQNKQ
jgi:short-subunit dehydrogenase